jgi:hypothetical protein
MERNNRRLAGDGERGLGEGLIFPIYFYPVRTGRAYVRTGRDRSVQKIPGPYKYFPLIKIPLNFFLSKFPFFRIRINVFPDSRQHGLPFNYPVII